MLFHKIVDECKDGSRNNFGQVKVYFRTWKDCLRVPGSEIIARLKTLEPQQFQQLLALRAWNLKYQQRNVSVIWDAQKHSLAFRQGDINFTEIID